MQDLNFARAIGEMDDAKLESISTIFCNSIPSKQCVSLITRLVTEGLRTTQNDFRALKKKLGDSKYSDEMIFGGFSDFLGGLEDLVGKPSRDLKEEMRKEHAHLSPVVSPNYHVHTTPQLEYDVVFSTTKPEAFDKTVQPDADPNLPRRDFKTLAQVREELALSLEMPVADTYFLDDLELAAIRLYTGESGTCFCGFVELIVYCVMIVKRYRKSAS